MNSLADLAGRASAAHVLHEKMRIAGEQVGRDRVIEVRNPYTGALVGTVPKATRRRHPPRVRRSPARTRPKLTRYERYRHLPARGGADPRPHRRDLRPHHRRVRHLQEGLALRGRPRLRRVRVRRQRGAATTTARSSPATSRRTASRARSTRCASRCWASITRDHAVQPSAEPGRAQGRAVDRDQQPDGAEADREDAAVRAAARRHPVRGRACRRRCSRSSPATRARSPTRCSTNPDVDLVTFTGGVPDRQVHRRQGRLQAAGARARRQRSDHRDGGRRPRRGGDARRGGLVQELRPALHGDQAHAGARGGRRRVRRAAGRADAGVDATATRWIPTIDMGTVIDEAAAMQLRGARQRRRRARREAPRRQRAARRAVLADGARPCRPGDERRQAPRPSARCRR